MSARHREILVALALALVLALNYPLLAAVDRALLVFGIPLLYLYLFLVWLLVIGALAVLGRRGRSHGED